MDHFLEMKCLTWFHVTPLINPMEYRNFIPASTGMETEIQRGHRICPINTQAVGGRAHILLTIEPNPWIPDCEYGSRWSELVLILYTKA